MLTSTVDQAVVLAMAVDRAMLLALVVEPPALVPVASPMASEVSGNYNISTAKADGDGYKSWEML